MKTVIETNQLEFDNNSFLIDLVKYDNGYFYVEIFQNFIDKEDGKNSIKINSTVLTDILKVLQNYHAKIPKNIKVSHKHITDSEQQKIQERYLKGVSIKDLSIQLDQTEELIEIVLKNNGIEIVENKLPKQEFWKMKKKKTNK